ncbi:hypothetical protein K438DRAFT_1808786 [Mycena galopus ATCC 62051]|nr:hypothetical protein K438DRAFT_1808786 [Mycena galopus ATCC 62051]
MNLTPCSKCGDFSTGLPAPEAHDLFAPPGTRHHTLLNTNEPLEDSDITSIHSTPTDARLRLLEEERALLSSYLTRNKALLEVAPLRRMPSELLGQIFLSALSSIADDLRVGGFDMARSPWVLTHVSSRWRAVALSIPALWSWVTIDYATDDKPPGLQPRYSLRLVETQIQRAQKLKIHFYGSSEVPSLTQVRIFELLAQHSSRWEELSVEVTQEMVPTVIALRDRVPSLTRVWIRWGKGGRAALESLDCFQTAPSLVDFDTNNEDLFIPITLPTHQLTRLGHDGPWNSLQGTLILSHNLVQAHITITFDEDPWPDVHDPIDLPHLRHMAFDKCLASFLDRWACPLRRLCLRGYPDSHATIEMLQKIDFLMSNLVVSSGNDTVVAPQLRSLFFASGAGWGSTLKNALLATKGYEPDPVTFRGLDALRREGLDVSLLTGAEAVAAIDDWLYATTWN